MILNHLPISAYSSVLKLDMKLFLNVARLKIGQLLTQGRRRGHPCTLDTFLVFFFFLILKWVGSGTPVPSTSLRQVHFLLNGDQIIVCFIEEGQRGLLPPFLEFGPHLALWLRQRLQVQRAAVHRTFSILLISVW